MTYRLQKVSDTMHNVRSGTKLIGSVRYDQDATNWFAKHGDTIVTGASAVDCFHNLVRARNNDTAVAHGFESAKDMLDKNNAAVQDHAEFLRSQGFNVRVRSTRGYLT